MGLSIKLVTLLPFVLSAMAAPAPGAQEDILRALINPPIDGSSITGPATSTSPTDNMVGALSIPSDQPIKSIKELEDALTASVKSKLLTSLANMTPEQVSTVTGGANPDHLSQLNLMGGINSLVSLIVQKILQSLLPRIFNQNAAPTTPNVGYPKPGGYNPQPSGGMFGSFGGSMNPMSMLMPGMMFGVMDKMFEFI